MMISAVQRYYVENQRMPTWAAWKRADRPSYAPSTHMVLQCFGNWNSLILAAGFPPNRQKIARSKIIRSVQQLANKLGRTPYVRDWKDAQMKPSATWIKEQFGSWNIFIEASGLVPNFAGPQSLPPGIAAKNEALRRLRHGASKRELECSLDDACLLAIMERDCAYCGAPPSNVAKSKTTSFAYNGIDRIDNSFGYIAGNVTSCCHDCNWAKKDRSVEDFIDHCRKVVANQ